ncbi:ABC transporter ATP-binding protein [Methanosalsum natronophilum]|uniref:ABC transporter ATP-binding protein n=1 Tax=Methanosalsum natronophilum TaxID=768733 RepID=A0A3R7VUY3_9EURY|nr:ABC transporter ATP-binding protein [Methanosalsum natronophilum]MCS3924879.1 putative ABC transport system ATP-binding protein [Methanosalsum natronophilum]RQD90151.1 MAG: ABC transporter ATP-binding protein [Methanosalsum natronophilum]
MEECCLNEKTDLDSSKELIIDAENICKNYQIGDMEVQILKNVNIRVRKGEFLAIMGPSGSGKSTLMNILGILDRPTCGTFNIMGRDIFRATDKELALIRGLEIGFVFQNFNLVPRLNSIQNVELPTFANKKEGVDPENRATELLGLVGLSDRMYHKPNELSGGQSQRVAIARALINKPSLILADEPTGNLDTKTGQEILDIFTNLHNEGSTIVMITHDPEIAEYADRIVYLRDGVIEDDRIN